MIFLINAPPYLSALNITMTEIAEMPVSKKNALLHELNEMRKAEAAALRKMNRKK